MSDTTTCNCDSGKHTICYGYVAPLVYSNTKPCECSCHATTGRDFPASLSRALLSFYGTKQAVAS